MCLRTDGRTDRQTDRQTVKMVEIVLFMVASTVSERVSCHVHGVFSHSTDDSRMRCRIIKSILLLFKRVSKIAKSDYQLRHVLPSFLME